MDENSWEVILNMTMVSNGVQDVPSLLNLVNQYALFVRLDYVMVLNLTD